MVVSEHEAACVSHIQCSAQLAGFSLLAKTPTVAGTHGTRADKIPDY